MADDDVVARMKHHVRGVLANLSAMMPCFNLGGSKLPKVTGKKTQSSHPASSPLGVSDLTLGVFSSPVSHHDTEIPFNPSFIEPPSTAWVSDSSFSSFDTDNEGPEYSVPPREGDLLPLYGSILLHCHPWVRKGWVLGMGSVYLHALVFLPVRTPHAWPHVVGCAWCGQPRFTTSSQENTPRDSPVASASLLLVQSVSLGSTSPNSSPSLAGIPLLGGAELQDGVSPIGEVLPDPSAFDSEDVSQPFAIPRTSSIAKAKRPSVSFAEGTKFGMMETPSPGRKPKAPWGPSKLSQPPGDRESEPCTEPPGSDCYESPDPISKGEESHRPSPRATPGGRRRVVSSTRHVAQRVEALEAAARSGSWEAKGKDPNVTTIYMMVGTAGQDPKAEGGGEGPVQAVLKRLGSLQRGKWAAKEEPKVRKSFEVIQKPPRRALGQRRDSVNSCKQRESIPGAAAEASSKHQPGKRQSFLLASPSLKSIRDQDGGSDAAGAMERGKSPELVLSLEAKGLAASEEEPKYENVMSSSTDSPPSTTEGPATAT